MLVSPVKQTKIVNETNICRYLMRLLGCYPEQPVAATVLDQWLDWASRITSGSSSEKNKALTKLAKHLSKSSYISGARGVEDIVICSAFLRSVTEGKWSKDNNLKKWCDSVSSSFQL